MSEIIGTDHPFSASERGVLVALLNTLIPSSEDGRLPGAGSLDLRDFLSSAPDPSFEQVVRDAVEVLGDDFADTNPAVREERVAEFSATHAEAFSQLYLQTLAVYYRQDEVLRGIGSGEGPPFPRGNEVVEGDTGLLDPVIANPKAFRPA